MLAEIHRLHATALGALNAPASECEGQVRAALEVARRQAARTWELRAASDLARLWRDRGRVSEARELLAPVYASFTEGFAFPDLVEARALLDELGAAPADDAGRVPGGAPSPAGPDGRGGPPHPR